jgi:hypothetical protein
MIREPESQVDRSSQAHPAQRQKIWTGSTLAKISPLMQAVSALARRHRIEWRRCLLYLGAATVRTSHWSIMFFESQHLLKLFLALLA